ncbi:hypothetical protein ABK040_000768 [Willaertia magna]
MNPSQSTTLPTQKGTILLDNKHNIDNGGSGSKNKATSITSTPTTSSSTIITESNNGKEKVNKMLNPTITSTTPTLKLSGRFQDKNIHSTENFSSPTRTSPVTTTSSTSSNQPSKPSLHFSGGFECKYPFSFDCLEGWRLNDLKSKHPHSTTHNCSIKDHIRIEGKDFSNCKCYLKLKDNVDGKVVTETFFTYQPPPIDTNVAEFSVVSKINNMKGSTSSRVAFLEIVDEHNKVICISDAFWVRSRSRSQMKLDLAKRKRDQQFMSVSGVGVIAPSLDNTSTSTTTSSTMIDQQQLLQQQSQQPLVPSPIMSQLIGSHTPTFISTIPNTSTSSNPLASLATLASMAGGPSEMEEEEERSTEEMEEEKTRKDNKLLPSIATALAQTSRVINEPIPPPPIDFKAPDIEEESESGASKETRLPHFQSLTRPVVTVPSPVPVAIRHTPIVPSTATISHRPIGGIVEPPRSVLRTIEYIPNQQPQQPQQPQQQTFPHNKKRKMVEDSRLREVTNQLEKNKKDIEHLYALVIDQNNIITELRDQIQKLVNVKKKE